MGRSRRRKIKKFCIDCGKELNDGNWRRCKECWNKCIDDFADKSDGEFELVIKIDNYSNLS